MTNPDSFIDEVREEVRKDRLYRMFRRYGWLPLLVVLAIVGGTAYREWSSAQERSTAEALGDNIISAEARAELSERIESLENIQIDSGNRDADAIRDLMVASAMAENGQLDEAVSRLASISSANDVSKVYRDLAQLRSISLRQDRIDTEDLLSELDGMIKNKSEFQLLAKEMMAHAYDRQGDKENAINTLSHLLNEDGLPDELYRRASEFLASLQQSR